MPSSNSKSYPIGTNRPGAPTNPPQHLMSEEPDIAGAPPVSPAGNPSPALGPADDAADPHPADEENYRRIRHPGGANPPAPATDIGANPETHTGSPPPPPNNARRDRY